VGGSRNRIFHCALGASLVLHALALAYPVTGKSMHRSAPQIVARLVEISGAGATPVKPRRSPRPVPATDAAQALSPDQYRIQLLDAARRYKRYPAFAREHNWQGEVLVALTLGAGGRASVALKASSGYDALDRQALEMLAQAARSVPLPPALRGTQFALEVRAVYGPED
jgi:TonB family protein